MKKLIIFLISALTLFTPLLTKAETTNFYEAEYIDNIFLNKLTPDKKTIYYQKARFFREKETNKIAYCIEPFNFFNATSKYESTVNPSNLTKDQTEKIGLYAHFGYGYKNHTGKEWYAVTQMLIWETADPEGKYYYTDSLNGNKIDNPYKEYYQELNNLIEVYKKTPSLNNQTYTTIVNKELILTDTNNVINQYTAENNNIKINSNEVIINNLGIGKHTIELTQNDNNYNYPLIFYQSSTSQNLVKTGDLKTKSIKFNVIVQETNIKVNKLDYDTSTNVSQGEGILDGAIYKIYDNNMKEIKTINIKNTTGIIKNLNYGKYYIKEEKPGTGYNLDNKTYNFEITPDKPNVELRV